MEKMISGEKVLETYGIDESTIYFMVKKNLIQPFRDPGLGRIPVPPPGELPKVLRNKSWKDDVHREYLLSDAVPQRPQNWGDCNTEGNENYLKLLYGVLKESFFIVSEIEKIELLMEVTAEAKKLYTSEIKTFMEEKKLKEVKKFMQERHRFQNAQKIPPEFLNHPSLYTSTPSNMRRDFLCRLIENVLSHYGFDMTQTQIKNAISKL